MPPTEKEQFARQTGIRHPDEPPPDGMDGLVGEADHVRLGALQYWRHTSRRIALLNKTLREAIAEIHALAEHVPADVSQDACRKAFELGEVLRGGVR